LAKHDKFVSKGCAQAGSNNEKGKHLMKLPIPVSERDHSIGPLTASVTVVNYGDYQSAGSQKRHREVERVFDELVNTVRFVYRHFPLLDAHPHALPAAAAAEAAAAQGKFWEMHRHLYLHPDSLEERHLRRYAKEIGLDLARFDREMAAGIYTDQVLKDYEHSVIYGITGAPTTFINDELYAMSGLELVQAVKAILKS
jgi:protein-disulfide isomerase